MCFYLIFFPLPSSSTSLYCPSSLSPSFSLPLSFPTFFSTSVYWCLSKKRGTTLFGRFWPILSNKGLLYSWLHAGPIPMHVSFKPHDSPLIKLVHSTLPTRKLWPDSQSCYMAEPETEIRSSESFLHWVETWCFILAVLLAKEPHLSVGARQLRSNEKNRPDSGSRFPNSWVCLGHGF